MAEAVEYPEMLTPPFWGTSDALVYDIDGVEVRALYCYIPLFREGETLVLMDPYEPTEELTTVAITPETSEFALRFRPESDLLVFCAASTSDYSPIKSEEISTRIATELRRGLSLPDQRGEMLNHLVFPLLSTENIEAITHLMAVEDRLWIEEDTPPTAYSYELFVHNSRKQ